MCYASAAATGSLYAAAADRVSAAESINASSALVALYGPILDVHSLGELAMTKTTVTYAVLVMALAIALVRRHTRVEEESGRAELLGGLAVDPRAPLRQRGPASGRLPPLLVAVTRGARRHRRRACRSPGRCGSPARGSASGWSAPGSVRSVRPALGQRPDVRCRRRRRGRPCCSGSGRVGDTTVGRLAQLALAVRLVDPAAGVVRPARVGAAPRPRVAAVPRRRGRCVLRARRDLGAGLVAERPGPATGSPRLADALALNLRVHATSLVVWTVACALLGALMAAIVPGVGSILDSDGARQMMERLGGVGALQETLVAALVSVGAVVITCFVATVVESRRSRGARRPHRGGAGHRDEPVDGVRRRSRWWRSGGAAWLLLVTGAGHGARVGRRRGVRRRRARGGPGADPRGLGGRPRWPCSPSRCGARWAVAGWVLVVAFFLLGPLAELLRLPGWVAGLSPYSHVSKVPAESLQITPELVLTAARDARGRHGLVALSGA